MDWFCSVIKKLSLEEPLGFGLVWFGLFAFNLCASVTCASLTVNKNFHGLTPELPSELCEDSFSWSLWQRTEGLFLIKPEPCQLGRDEYGRAESSQDDLGCVANCHSCSAFLFRKEKGINKGI